MDNFSLVNYVFALITSIGLSTGACFEYIKKYVAERKIAGTYEQEKQDIFRFIVHLSATACFIKITGVVLTFGFILLYELQNNTNICFGVIPKIFNSGIHVPILLLLYGKIISFSFNVFSNASEKKVLSNDDYVAMVFIASVSVNICMFFVQPDFGLLILAIVIGKAIWTDYVYKSTEVFSYFKVHKKNIIAAIYSQPPDKVNAVWLSIQYVRNYIALFLSLEFIYYCIKHSNTSQVDTLDLNMYIVYFFYLIAFRHSIILTRLSVRKYIIKMCQEHFSKQKNKKVFTKNNRQRRR